MLLARPSTGRPSLDALLIAVRRAASSSGDRWAGVATEWMVAGEDRFARPPGSHALADQLAVLPLLILRELMSTRRVAALVIKIVSVSVI
jgi:hypothetical protein